MADFNPLGQFNATAPVNPAILAAARLLVAKLPDCPKGTIDHIYDHWTVGHYTTDFQDYNISIRHENGHFYFDITHDPRDNARGVNNNSEAAHTWLRNTGGLGISTDDMVFAQVHNFGPEPTTLLAIEYLCAANAAAAQKYDIDLSGRTPSSVGGYANELPLMTHAVAAMTGGNPAPSQWYDYGISGTCERWDYSTFVAVPVNVALVPSHAHTCNSALLIRSHIYKLALG